MDLFGRLDSQQLYRLLIAGDTSGSSGSGPQLHQRQCEGNAKKTLRIPASLHLYPRGSTTQHAIHARRGGERLRRSSLFGDQPKDYSTATAGITRDMSQIWGVRVLFLRAFCAAGDAFVMANLQFSLPYLCVSSSTATYFLLHSSHSHDPFFPCNAGSGETPTLHYSPTRLAFHFDREDSMEEFFSRYLR
jgi:hypothetical protein